MCFFWKDKLTCPCWKFDVFSSHYREAVEKVEQDNIFGVTKNTQMPTIYSGICPDSILK